MLVLVARPLLYTAGVTSQSVAFFHTLTQGLIRHWSLVETPGSLTHNWPDQHQHQHITILFVPFSVFSHHLVFDCKGRF